MSESKHICIVLGSGFSMPANLPLAREINNFFTRDNTETLLKFSSGEWKWWDYANEADRNNGRIGLEYLFYGYVLNEFVSAFIENSGGFSSYENFYQFVLDIDRNSLDFKGIYEKSIAKIQQRFPDHTESPYIMASLKNLQNPGKNEIISLINHLIADLLYVRAPLENYYEAYTFFFRFIRDFPEITITTLNHDTLLEYLMALYKLDFSDGFTLEKSILLADSGEKIKMFANDFNVGIPIIKLHGSIDMYQYPIYQEEGSTVTPLNKYLYYKPDNYHDKHMVNRIDPGTGKIVQRFHWNIIPQFITGTRKDEIIANDEMYACLYSQFEKRIHASETLLIIGYSFGDEHVNNQIRSSISNGFLKKIINVNPGEEFPFSDSEIECMNIKSIQELTLER